jgi:hypothetical protein
MNVVSHVFNLLCCRSLCFRNKKHHIVLQVVCSLQVFQLEFYDSNNIWWRVHITSLWSDMKVLLQLLCFKTIRCIHWLHYQMVDYLQVVSVHPIHSKGEFKNNLTLHSIYFLLKKVVELKEWPKIRSERGVVSYTNARKKDSRMPFWLPSFWERTSGMAFHHKNTPDITSHNIYQCTIKITLWFGPITTWIVYVTGEHQMQYSLS